LPVSEFNAVTLHDLPLWAAADRNYARASGKQSASSDRFDAKSEYCCDVTGRTLHKALDYRLLSNHKAGELLRCCMRCRVL
jgi:hypothetical protein